MSRRSFAFGLAAGAVLLCAAAALAWLGTPAQVSAAADLAVALTAIATASFLIWDRLNARPARLTAWGDRRYDAENNVFTLSIDVESDTPEPIAIRTIRAEGWQLADPGDGSFVAARLRWRSEHRTTVTLRRDEPHHRFVLMLRGDASGVLPGGEYHSGQPSPNPTPRGISSGGAVTPGQSPVSAVKSSLGRAFSSFRARRRRSNSLTIQIVFCRASDRSRRITRTIRIE